MKRTLLELIIIGIRFLLGFILFTSGVGKLTGGDFFPVVFFPMSLEEMLAPYGLGLWGVFVAWSEVAIGLLLLSQRFATLGAIMCLPLIANIFIITVSLRWQGTPYVNGFFLALNLFLLAADYHKLKFLFFDDVEPLRTMPLRRNYAKIDLLWLAGIVLCLLSVALHTSSRYLTFGLTTAGVGLFLGCAVWHYLRTKRIY